MCAYFYHNGYCSKGDTCNFSHVIIPGAPIPKRVEEVGRSRPSPTGYVIRERLRGTKPCKWFMEHGYCKKGDACTFSHDVSIFTPGLLPTPFGAFVVPPQSMSAGQPYYFAPGYPAPETMRQPRMEQWRQQQQQRPQQGQQQRRRRQQQQGQQQQQQNHETRQRNTSERRRGTRHHP